MSYTASTQVFASHALFNYSEENLAGDIAARAAEVIHDNESKFYTSR